MYLRDTHKRTALTYLVAVAVIVATGVIVPIRDEEPVQHVLLDVESHPRADIASAWSGKSERRQAGGSKSFSSWHRAARTGERATRRKGSSRRKARNISMATIMGQRRSL